MSDAQAGGVTCPDVASNRLGTKIHPSPAVTPGREQPQRPKGPAPPARARRMLPACVDSTAVCDYLETQVFPTATQEEKCSGFGGCILSS